MSLDYPQKNICSSSPILALRVPPWRSKLVVGAFLVAFAGLFTRAIYVMALSDFTSQAQVVRDAISKDTLSLIAIEIERLNQLALRTDSLSIFELQQALKRSVDIASIAAVDLELQAKTWKDIRERIAEDKMSHESLKAELVEVKKLHALEIARIKSIIDIATQPNMWTVFFNHFVSFIFGVISSIIASWIYDQRKMDIKNARKLIGEDQILLD